MIKIDRIETKEYVILVTGNGGEAQLVIMWTGRQDRNVSIAALCSACDHSTEIVCRPTLVGSNALMSYLKDVVFSWITGSYKQYGTQENARAEADEFLRQLKDVDPHYREY